MPGSHASHRGFTFPEMMAILVVISMLALVGVASLRSTENAGRETQARNALTLFAGAQTQRHDTFGSFVDDPDDVDSKIVSTADQRLVYVSGATPSTADTMVSFTTGSTSGGDYVAAAVLAQSGKCFTVKVFESSSSTEDDRRVFRAGTVPCTGATAAATIGGDSW